MTSGKPTPAARGLSPARARQLRPLLDQLIERSAREERIGFDPVEFPHRYSDRSDIEVVALLSACLAYGRADLFKPKIERLLLAMGRSPAAFVRLLDVRQAKRLLGDFVYRFNVGTDVAVLLLGVGQALRRPGGLEGLFASEWAFHRELHASLAGFTRTLRQSVPLGPVRAQLGPERGLDHLLPLKAGPGAAKRLLLFLRWMVRGPDRVDFGIWRAVGAQALVIPLDTHVGRLARQLGLTRRSDLSWRTAEEITAALRQIDPADPVRFDFALCHHGMAGHCPARPEARACAACLLRPACPAGLRRAQTSAPASSAQSPRSPKICRSRPKIRLASGVSPEGAPADAATATS